jgi:hypothetical protein
MRDRIRTVLNSVRQALKVELSSDERSEAALGGNGMGFTFTLSKNSMTDARL